MPCFMLLQADTKVRIFVCKKNKILEKRKKML